MCTNTLHSGETFSTFVDFLSIVWEGYFDVFFSIFYFFFNFYSSLAVGLHVIRKKRRYTCVMVMTVF